tara:strand:- start:678 stop:971 length:294 start_codon:yes stop_codon:yes gene_type:complete
MLRHRRSRAFLAAGCTGQGLNLAAKALAKLAASLIEEQNLLQQARADHAESSAGHPFRDPLAAEIMPALVPHKSSANTTVDANLSGKIFEHGSRKFE